MNTMLVRTFTGTVGVATLLGTTVAFAQTTNNAESTGDPTACAAAIDAQLAAELPMMDNMHEARKEMMQKRAEAMKAALAITDDAARQEAIKAAMESNHEIDTDDMKERMDAMKDIREEMMTACGGLLKHPMMKRKEGETDMRGRFMKMNMHRSERPAKVQSSERSEN